MTEWSLYLNCKEVHKEGTLTCLHLVLIKLKQLQSREPAYCCATVYSLEINRK